MVRSAFEVKRLSGSLGAEIRGVDLADMGAGSLEEVKRLFWEHLVLFFPEQNLSNPEQLALGERFGESQGHPHLENPSLEAGKIFELAATLGGIADEWHSDLSFLPKPALISIFQMMKCPAVGGDTLWSNLYRAYEQLSPPLQELCSGLTALHNAEPHGRPEIMHVHPVVRVHPETGRRALFVNEHFTRRIVELSFDESKLLLDYLSRWIASPRFNVRYGWSEGTVALWDNRCTQHFVVNDFEGERVVQRVTVMGDQPEGVGAPKWPAYKRPGRSSDTSRHDRLLKNYLREQSSQGES